MTIRRWKPPVALSQQEKMIVKLLKRTRKLYVFLRKHRHQIFDNDLQRELEAAYRDTGAGKEPIAPAMMAMATIIQTYERVSDAQAVQLSAVDLRWQMVLGTVGSVKPAFSQGAFFDFRQRMIATGLDKRMLQRTAQIARSTKGFDAKKLPKSIRVAIDSSPLQGAGRVEDTFNLIGHAARKVVDCTAQLLKVDFEEVCRRAGIPLLLESSVKKALDRDWSDTHEKAQAIDRLAREVLALERWLDKHLADEVSKPPLQELLDVLDQLVTQDLEPDPDGDGVRIADGVAEDRRISVEDGEMRHGRKSKSKRIDGYKRHVARDLDGDAIVACTVTPANQPEHEALPVLKADIEEQNLELREAHFDRGYMGSPAVQEIIRDGGKVICKPWKTGTGEVFAKEDFDLDLHAKTIMCPGGVIMPIALGKKTTFPAQACDACCLRDQCTQAAPGNGRSVHIANDEPLQQSLRKLMKTKTGRELFRERVPVEHSLAHIGYRQGLRARYRGTRKNVFDLHRTAIIQNLEIAQRKEAA